MGSASDVKCNLKLSYLYYQEVGNQRRTKKIGCFFGLVVSVVNAIKAVFIRAMVPMSELDAMAEDKKQNSSFVMQVQQVRSRHIEEVLGEPKIPNLSDGVINELSENDGGKPNIRKKPILVANASGSVDSENVKKILGPGVDVRECVEFIQKILSGKAPVSCASEQRCPIWFHTECRFAITEKGDLYMMAQSDGSDLTTIENSVAFKAGSDSSNSVMGGQERDAWNVEEKSGEYYVIHKGFRKKGVTLKKSRLSSTRPIAKPPAPPASPTKPGSPVPSKRSRAPAPPASPTKPIAAGSPVPSKRSRAPAPPESSTKPKPPEPSIKLPPPPPPPAPVPVPPAQQGFKNTDKDDEDRRQLHKAICSKRVHLKPAKKTIKAEKVGVPPFVQRISSLIDDKKDTLPHSDSDEKSSSSDGEWE